MINENQPTKITLLLGGARSGKSSLAEKLARTRATDPGGILYVATLQPADDQEMRERVARPPGGPTCYLAHAGNAF